MRIVRLTFEIPCDAGQSDEEAIAVAKHKMNFAHPRPKAVKAEVVELPDEPAREVKTDPAVFLPSAVA